MFYFWVFRFSWSYSMSSILKTQHSKEEKREIAKPKEIPHKRCERSPQYPDSVEIVGYRLRWVMHLSLSMNSEWVLQFMSFSRLTRDSSRWDREPLASLSCWCRDARVASSCLASSSKLRTREANKMKREREMRQSDWMRWDKLYLSWGRSLQSSMFGLRERR